LLRADADGKAFWLQTYYSAAAALEAAEFICLGIDLTDTLAYVAASHRTSFRVEGTTTNSQIPGVHAYVHVGDFDLDAHAHSIHPALLAQLR
jgi:hypothetical protein